MIDLSEQEGVAVLRLADGKANALSIDFCQTLAGRFDEGQRSCSAVVLIGSGRIFSAGVDLLRLLEGGAPYIRKFLPALNAMFSTVFCCPKPVVAAINGHAIAGGCVLACAADQRLMVHDDGRIGVTELLVGVPFPPVAFEIMRCATAPEFFADALYSGATYPPPEALRRGLVHELVNAEQLLERAIAAALKLAALPPGAFALTKRQIREPVLARLDQTQATDAAIEQIWTAPETLDRIRDYVGRTLRKPPPNPSPARGQGYRT